MTDIGVAIGTYGDLDAWSPLARRALQSVREQSVEVQVQWCHRATLQEARNEAAYTLLDKGVSWLMFLDADDELDLRYIEHMARAIGGLKYEDMPILQPSTLGVVDGKCDDYPVLMKNDRSLLIKNHLILGCMHRARMFKKLEGFHDYPLLEDWDYWLRSEENGSVVYPVPEAIYKVHFDTARVSRNKSKPEVETENLIQHIRNQAKARRGIL